MQPTLQTLAGRIHARRQELHITMHELAEAVGYSNRGMIWKLENCELDPPATRLAAIAQALHTTPDWLLGWPSPLPARDKKNTAHK